MIITIRYPWLTYWFFNDFCLHPVYLPCADKPGSLGSPASDLVFDLLPLFFPAVICKARRVFHLAGSVASLCLSSVLTDGGENTQVLLITRLKCPQALMPTKCCFVSSHGPKAWVAFVNRIAVHKRITNVCCCFFFFYLPKSRLRTLNIYFFPTQSPLTASTQINYILLYFGSIKTIEKTVLIGDKWQMLIQLTK